MLYLKYCVSQNPIYKLEAYTKLNEFVFLALAIHISHPAKQLLDKFENFKVQRRGEIPVKGKGALTTYWLLEESRTIEQSTDDSEIHV